MSKLEGLTLGADPELMLWDTQQKKIVSAIPVLAEKLPDGDIVPHDKHNPIDLGDGYKMYSDNVLVEMSMPPAKLEQNVDIGSSFAGTVSWGLAKMRAYLGERYALKAVAAHIFEDSELDHAQAKEVGCNPNFDVYARAMNLPSEFRSGLRTGSFHIHIGHPEVRGIKEQEEVVKLMDIFVGCASVIFDKDESAPTRRALYGRAGEFRPTPYGVEYRVLGNWALRSRGSILLVADLTVEAIKNRGVLTLTQGWDNSVQRAINSNDKSEAQRILNICQISSHLMRRIHQVMEPGAYLQNAL